MTSNDNLTAEFEKTVAEDIGTMRLEIIKLRLIGQKAEARASAAEAELTAVKIENVKLKAEKSVGARHHVVGPTVDVNADAANGAAH